MEIILLDEARFDSFAMSQPNYNFYQTSNYGKLMSKHGHNTYYLGLVDDQNNIKAATLMIVKNEKDNKRKMGYAPRGFLIDWKDTELVKTFTEKIKEFLSKRSFTFLKVDPYIVYKTYDYKKNININGETNESFVSNLQSLGYIHMGYNNGMEASKPRWNAITKLDNNINYLYNSISKEARQKINDAIRMGCKVYKGTSNDINLLFDMIGKAMPPIDYYLDYYQFYNINNSFEIYFTKLEPVISVNSSKTAYENEEQKNSLLNEQIQNYSISNKEVIINEKMKSDELLSKYKKDMVDAINLFQNYPSGIVISGTIVIKIGKKVYFIAEGSNNNFIDYYPDYLLKWQLIQTFALQGYEIVDYNGINGDFNSNDHYDILKKELSNEIVEYVGEFDLVINKKAYYTGGKLNPILSWLNTPI